MNQQTIEKFLQNLFDKTWQAASPQNCVPAFLPPPPKGKTVVIGAGKASAAMAQVFENAWTKDGKGEFSGKVLTRYGHGAPTKTIEIIEASHPVPDAAGLEGAKQIVELVSDLTADDLVVCLISGGGSSLLTAPANGISLAEKQDINQQLLMSGAPIDEMNCVRKHLSSIKGGRLALAAYPARVVTLIISDVPGDDPSVVASGPTVGDITTRQQAIEICNKYGLKLPQSVKQFLASDACETPNPDDERLKNTELHIIAAPAIAVRQAETEGKAAGFQVINLGDDIEGEAREVALEHAKLVLAAKPTDQAILVISGGETTVTVKGNGRGGRNAEYALALATALDGHPKISAIACDTDGIDGVEDNAGAIINPTTLARAKALGLNPQSYLDNNDAYGFFEQLDDLVFTGPTRTNVNDFRAILIAK